MPTVTGRATDFIQFSRPGATGGGATVTDRDGKIKWAGHNLRSHSENFDASVWSKNSATVVANAAVAPDGTMTADEITFLSVGGSVNCAGSTMAVINGATYTQGVWLRAKTGTFKLKITRTDSASWATATVSDEITLTTAWQLVQISYTPSSSPAVVDFVIGSEGKTPYNMPATGSIFAWGAHLYRSDLGSMVLNPARGDAYYPTTPRNLLGFTEDFSNAAWVKTNLAAFGSGSVANAIIAPNGLQTADKVVSSTASGYHGIYQSSAVLTDGVYTVSVYAKAAEYSLLRINDAASSRYFVSFNLATGAVVAGSTGGARYVSSSITGVGDGWYRCSVVISNVSAGTAINFAGYPAGATLDAFGASYTGDGTSGIYLWGAQLSDSASLDAYSPVYGAAVTSAAYYAPRLDFDANGSALGLLVEEQRTNLQLHSEALDNVFWTKFGATAAANNATAPSGTMTADTITEDTSNGAHYLATGITLATNTSVAYSFYARRSSGTRNLRVTLFTASSGLRALVNFDTLSVTNQSYGSATYTSGAVTSVGSGWYRVVIVGVPSSTEANPAVDFVFHNGTGVSYIGDGTSGFQMWGFQAEANATFATSYIPTGASTATRTADVASVSTQAFPYSASEGTLVASATVYGVGVGKSSGIVSLSDGSAAENIAMFRTSSVNNIALEIRDNNSTQATYTVAMGTQPIKSAIAYALNNSNAALNGVAQTTDTTCTMPIATSMIIGAIYAGSDFSTNGWIRQITYLPRRISNSELAARTA